MASESEGSRRGAKSSRGVAISQEKSQSCRSEDPEEQLFFLCEGSSQAEVGAVKAQEGRFREIGAGSAGGKSLEGKKAKRAAACRIG